ncbi:MAG: hypothetical protein ACYCSO_08535 [Cuniculiplasma sp.]
MAKKDDFDILVQNLAYYRGDRGKTEAFMKKFLGLWSSYGDRKFLGKKGKRILSEKLKELYVMMDVSRERIEDLQKMIDQNEKSSAEMDRIKNIRAQDSIKAEKIKFNQLEERYKFMSMLHSINELMSGKDAKFVKSLDKTLKNRKVVSSFQDAIKDEMNDHGKIMGEMDKLELYFETLSDSSGVKMGDTSNEKNNEKPLFNEDSTAVNMDSEDNKDDEKDTDIGVA